MPFKTHMRGRPNKEEKYHGYISQLEAKEKRDTYRQLIILVIVAVVSIGGFWVFKVGGDNSDLLAQQDYQLNPTSEKEVENTETSFETEGFNSLEFGESSIDEYENNTNKEFVDPERLIVDNKKNRGSQSIRNNGTEFSVSTVNDELENRPSRSSTKSKERENVSKKAEIDIPQKSINLTPNINRTKSQPPQKIPADENLEENNSPPKASSSPDEIKTESSFISKPDKAGASPKNNRKPLQVAEKMPQFPGGVSAMNKFISQRINYPLPAKDHDVQGKVYLQFVVEPNGSLQNMRVVRGLGYGCDEEALRVAKKMPKWIPGEEKGHRVAVIYTLAVQFSIQ